MRISKLALLGVFFFSGNMFVFANVPAVCPGYGREGGVDDNFLLTEILSYGYHINISLSGTKLVDQVVNYVYLDSDTGKILKQGSPQNNLIAIDEIESSSLRPFTSLSVSANKNRKLMIWGLDFQGYKVATELYLKLNLNNVKVENQNAIA